MRVAFYNAPAFTEHALRYRLNPPLAPAILAAVFEQAGHEAEAADLEALGVGPERLARSYAAQRDRWPDAIGFTVCSFAARGAEACARALREAGYGGYIALGGPHITLLGRGPVDELESWGADAWVVGECEGNVVRVFEERQRGLIQGERAPIESIPAPLWAKHRPGVGVVYAGNQPFTGHPEWISMWSRGCPHACTFCPNVVFGRQAIRRRPAAAIQEELAGLARRGIKSVYVYDDELIGFPGRHNDWVADVCREVAPLGLRYKAQGRCSERAVTPDVLGEMAAAGFRAVQWGVESFSERVLNALHKGTRWSDGEPFDTSCIGWWYDHVVMNPELTKTPPQRWSSGTPPATAELRIVDDVTFVVTFQSPFPLFMDGQNRHQPFVPGHYLAQFHAELTPDRAALDKLVADKQLAAWTDLFAEMNTWYNNPDLPTVGPWKAENKLSEELFIMKRNPYFWGVDPEGNQLPYVDQVNHRLFSSPDVLNLWIVNGEIDFQWRHLSIGNYTLFKENEAAGQYELKLWKTDKGETLTINHDSQDSRLAKFFQNRDVRIAMNLAMDRDEINELVYDGLMTPRQASPNSMSPEYHEGAATAYAYYAPDEANALLDQAGYAERDAEGFRLWDDGSGEPISFIIEGFRVEGSPEVDAVLMVCKYLEEVGIKATYKSEERALYEERRQANLVDAAWYTVGHFALVMLVHHNYYVGQLVDRPWAGGWGLWALDPNDPNGHPPPDGHFLWRMWEIWDRALIEPDPQKRIALNLEILDIWAEEVPVVGIVGEAPGPTVVKNGLRNCSGIYMITDGTCDEALIGMPTLFWDDPAAHA